MMDVITLAAVSFLVGAGAVLFFPLVITLAYAVIVLPAVVLWVLWELIALAGERRGETRP